MGISRGALGNSSSGFSIVISNPVAGRLQTNTALGLSPGISSYYDTESFEISAGSTNKNGIYIGGQSASDPQVVRIYNQNINSATFTQSGLLVNGTLLVLGQVASNSKNVLSVLDTQAGQAPVAITVGASPFAYTATYGGSVAVGGGVVTQMTLTRGGVVFWTTTLANDVVPVRAGDILTVSYTTVPVMYQASN